jgi:hypothetical protein
MKAHITVNRELRNIETDDGSTVHIEINIDGIGEKCNL